MTAPSEREVSVSELSLGELASGPLSRSATDQRSRIPVQLVSNPSDSSEAFWKRLEVYRQARAYSDQAYVRLRYPQGGKMLEDRAPLAVHWISPNQMEIKAYDARLRTGRQNLWLWIEDPATDFLDRQLVKRNLPERLTLETLLEDRIWSDSAAAGLAGPPPQLTWLFLDAPKDERPNVEPLPSVTMEGRLYERYAIGMGSDRRTFWIDTETGLIRRLEFPPPPTPDGSTAELVVELEEASFSSTKKLLIERLPEETREVSRLVPPREPFKVDDPGQHRKRSDT